MSAYQGLTSNPVLDLAHPLASRVRFLCVFHPAMRKAVDLSQYGIAGTITSTANPKGVSPWGSCLAADGSTTRATFAHRAHLSLPTWTIAAWVRATGMSSNGIIHKGQAINRNYFLGVTGTTPYASCTVGASNYRSAISSVSMASSRWYHCCGTHDGSTVRFYLDGVLTASISSGTPDLYTGPLYIGAVDGSSSFWNGHIAGPMVLAGALTGPQVRALAADHFALVIPARAGSQVFAFESTGLNAARVTQAGLLTVAQAVPQARMTQAGALAVTSSVPQARVSQAGLLTVTPTVVLGPGFPVILIDSGGGSDTAASGAGPPVALTGSAASTSADGLTVTLDGAPDLSGVLTNGSHAIYLADTVSAARNFGAITAKDNSAKTVLVNTAFGGTLSGKSWAIGGKRASFGSTTSKKLVDNVSNGDALPGWTIRLLSGHAETSGTIITCRRSGSPTTGRITIEGEADAGVMPTLTQTANANCISLGAQSYITVQNLRFRNTSVAKSSTVGVNTPGLSCILRNLRGDDAAAALGSLINAGSGGQGLLIEDCYAAYTTFQGISFLGAIVRNNFVKNASTSGFLDNSSSRYRSTLIGNVAVNCAAGLTLVGAGTLAEDASLILNNTFHGNLNGIVISATSVNFGTLIGLVIANNNITANASLGISFSGAGVDEAFLRAVGATIRYNNFGTSASGTGNGTDINSEVAGIATNSLNVDPGYTNPASDDYSVGINLKAQGFPQRNIGVLSGTRSWVDVGAAQRQESGGAGYFAY